jgi:hypothetical protein
VQHLSPRAKQAVMQMLVPELAELAMLDDLDDLADYDKDYEFWDEEAGMTHQQLLAAETFHYSYANYADHLGIGNIRFDQLMPDDVDTLEQAEQEGWDDARLAEALEVKESQVPDWRESYRRAKFVVDAPTLAESFRRGVRFSVQDALEEQEKGKLTSEKLIERIVGQVCYRAADLAYVLDMRDERLAQYSSALREESGVDWEDLGLSQASEASESQ